MPFKMNWMNRIEEGGRIKMCDDQEQIQDNRRKKWGKG